MLLLGQVLSNYFGSLPGLVSITHGQGTFLDFNQKARVFVINFKAFLIVR